MTRHEEFRARLNPRRLNVTDVIVHGTGIQRGWLKVFRVKEWSTTTCCVVLAASGVGLGAVVWVVKGRL